MWAIKRTSLRRQSGAALVEMAITLSLFLLLVFAIIEFALAYNAWARINEAARDTARTAIVSNPVVDISGMPCPGGAPIDVTCTATSCATLLVATGRVAAFVQPQQVHVRYACGNAGNPSRPRAMMIPEVTVEIRDVYYPFIVPSLLGLGTSMLLPSARVTRTGEDMYTEGSGG